MTKSELNRYHDPYTNLAAAIIASGERSNDTSFLNSDWCDTLRTICKLDDEMYGHRNIELRSRGRVSNAHLQLEVD